MERSGRSPEETADALTALELRKVCYVIKEVLVGSVEMHQSLLQDLAVYLLKPVKGLGTFECDKILRTCFEMIGFKFYSRCFDDFSWILKEQWRSIVTEKYGKKRKTDA